MVEPETFTGSFPTNLQDGTYEVRWPFQSQDQWGRTIPIVRGEDPMPSGHNPAQDSSPGGHLGLSLAPLSNVLILDLDLREDAIQVQVPVVVHGRYHIGIIDCLLYLGQLQCSRTGISPLEMFSTHI